MNNVRQIESEDIIFYEEQRYKDIDKEEYLSVFDKLKADRILEGRYEDESWTAYTGIKSVCISFRIDVIAYASHLRKRINCPPDQFADILKCFALLMTGSYVFPTITERINLLVDFSEKIGDKGYRIDEEEAVVVQDFFTFAGIPMPEIEKMLMLVHQTPVKDRGVRKLAHLINYMAIASEIRDIYEAEISDEDFIKWFPIFFWTSVTFIIPLRATEMMVTPYDCIREENGELYISLRRTMLKKHFHTVYYRVEKDYKIFTYRIPKTDVSEKIRKYQQLTKDHTRKYLFDYNYKTIHELMSVRMFNKLLEDFIKTYLVGNRKYDYARYASGVEEFDIVTAGDSRPIALANLYFQDVGLDICRQLADHVHLNTTYGYCTNVTNTIYASSIMQLQRRINKEKEKTERFEAYYRKQLSIQHADSSSAGCMSPKMPHITGDISDCISEDHVNECLGCRFYRPSQDLLEESLEKRKKDTQAACLQVLKQMSLKKTVKEADFEKMFLEAYTAEHRYKTACDENAAQELEKWHRKKYTQTSS